MTALSSQPQGLGDLRVLDLSRWVAGEFATRLFGDYGADVVKIEKPGEGSLTRHWGPFPRDEIDLEASALFLHLNLNKRSIALDLTDATDRQVLLDLIADADALVESFRPGQLERLGLAPDTLQAYNPRLVVTRISGFGQTGPYRDYEATGLVLQAMGGPMNATGDAARAPLRKPGLVEQYTIGRAAAAATMAGLFSARRTGRGSVIDISSQEVLLSSGDRRASYLTAASYSGRNAPRGTRSAHRGASTFTGPFRANDGYVMLYVTNKVFWNRLVNFVGADDPDFRAKYLDRGLLGDDRDEFRAYVADYFSGRSKLDLMTEGQAARIPLTAMMQLDELLDHPHFRSRGVYVQGSHPVAGPLDYVGPSWRVERGYQLRRTAPLLDFDGAELRKEVGQQ